MEVSSGLRKFGVNYMKEGEARPFVRNNGVRGHIVVTNGEERVFTELGKDFSFGKKNELPDIIPHWEIGLLEQRRRITRNIRRG